MWPKNILMVEPTYFDIKYSINPYMRDPGGNLKTIDRPLALKQWEELKKVYNRLGLAVETIPGGPELPDMVFCANPFFPFKRDGRLQVIASRMTSAFRQQEVEHIKDWALGKNTEVYELPAEMTFEGMGDALWNYETGEIFGGYGFRTTLSAYDTIEKIVGRSVIRLKLIDERFYHMDTALSILNHNTALVVREAFTEEGFQMLRLKFSNLIQIDLQEALTGFAANACCVDGHNVVIQAGNQNTVRQLLNAGFNVHTVDTSEYIKSGGSVFCMKMLF